MIHIEKEEGEIMKVKKIVVILLVVVLGIWGLAVYDINTRLPIRKIEQYTQENPALQDGLKFTPHGFVFYTESEYFNLNQETFTYRSNMSNPDDESRIIVFNLEVENTTSEQITFKNAVFCPVSVNSGFFNGCSEDSSKRYITIEAGEIKNIKLVTRMTPSLVDKKYIENLKDDTFRVIFWCYPIQKELIFDCIQ